MSGPQPRGRDDYRYFKTIATRWSDNDSYGHVNNVIYYQWFDTAVNQWLIANGLLDIEAGDPIGLVVETGCTYFSALAFPGFEIRCAPYRCHDGCGDRIHTAVFCSSQYQ